MPLPTANTPPAPGNSRAAFGFRLRIICTATQQTNAVKKPASGLAGTLAAKSVPSSVPTRIPGVIWATIFHSTAPCW
ncbi:MAG: hypothetical protein CAPSK01_002510 [Candidatus Accumulibacter vicinus]|uniref:Uncharacterized protein n=1 Tax=Candidatus Accumulibacter vicinus TaxID=2954382 RepID=A0A084XZM8_9PROT|nr:MAG: hypothetical protein CAPSK01_002510 [Candidatus Accumulibacter vicinus]